MRSFAVIELMNDISEAPVKFNVLRRAPGFIFEWYIKKFNPFTTEKIEIMGQEGLLVRLPLTGADLRERTEYFNEMAERTLYTVRDYGVSIVLPPVAVFPEVITRADGRNVFPFFIMPAIQKALKLVGKNAKTTEIALIDGKQRLTLSILDNIYPHVNYLTLITPTPEAYAQKAAEIYGDCGLNIQVTDYNRSSLVSADVVINTQDEHKFDHYYKRGAICFELCGHGREMALKREDMLIVDGLRLSNGECSLNLERFECGLYVMSQAYRSLLSAYSSRTAASVAERISSTGYSAVWLCFQNKSLNAADLAKVFRKAGFQSG